MVRFEHRVRYHEVDQQAVLFNARYLEIADVGHTEFIRSLGWTYPELNAIGADPSVVHLDADFSSSVRFDDVLQVEVECVRVGRSSFVLRTRFLRDERELAVITATHVNVDAAEGRARSLPDAFAEALRAAATNKKTEDKS